VQGLPPGPGGTVLEGHERLVRCLACCFFQQGANDHSIGIQRVEHVRTGLIVDVRYQNARPFLGDTAYFRPPCSWAPVIRQVFPESGGMAPSQTDGSHAVHAAVPPSGTGGLPPRTAPGDADRQAIAGGDAVVDITQTVVDDQGSGRFLVHRSAFTSRAVLDREREQIFEAAWLYVGHESEIKNPGDFVTRRVAGRPVIFTRDRIGAPRVLLNTCRHRGAEVCRMKRGNARVFTCFYHGWAYDSTGRLVSVPDGDAYSPAFDRSTLGLVQPRADSYRGFVFVNLGGRAEPLTDYLDDARYLLDLLADQSVAGMRIVSGQHSYSMNANWKLLMENGIDGQHGMTVHQTYFEMMGNLGSPVTLMADSRVLNTGIDLGRGHSMTLSPELGSPFLSDDVRRELHHRRADHVRRLGEPHARQMLDTTRNVNIFPNLVLIDIQFGIQVRTMWPTAPGHTEITGWQLTPSDASDDVHTYRMTNAMTFWGPAGLATPDDIEALEQCQRGFAAESEVGFSDLSRGSGKPDSPGGGELPQRAFWRAWNARINGIPYVREGTRWDTSYLARTHGGSQA
jgi:phenylpropionate dioxygenase-like ring-hydroxylating dioxygenase large terminal subunit